MDIDAAAAEARREYKRKWRDKHREHIRAYSRAWRSKNRDRVKAYNRAYWTRKAAADAVAVVAAVEAAAAEQAKVGDNGEMA